MTSFLLFLLAIAIAKAQITYSSCSSCSQPCSGEAVCAQAGTGSGVCACVGCEQITGQTCPTGCQCSAVTTNGALTCTANCPNSPAIAPQQQLQTPVFLPTPEVAPYVAPQFLPSEPEVAPFPPQTPEIFPPTPEVQLVPGVAPGLVPELAPGLVPELAPGLVTELAPGLVPEFAPGIGPELAPGLVPELAPGLVPELVPGLVPELAPGLVPALVPETVPTQAPGVTFAPANELSPAFEEAPSSANGECAGMCDESSRPSGCGSTESANSSSFNAYCVKQYTASGYARCGWSTNCGCAIQTNSQGSFCGSVLAPQDSCYGAPGTFIAKQSCSYSNALAGCGWNVQCLPLSACNCSGQQPTACPNGTSLPAGATLQSTCVPGPNNGACAWQTNCQVNVCANQCDNNNKPTTCPSPYALLPTETNGVQCECNNIQGKGCTWIPTNCYPKTCTLTLSNGQYMCGTEALNCTLECNLDPSTLCTLDSTSGNCKWNYQCPSTTQCVAKYDSNCLLGNACPAMCGTVPMPNCSNGQIQSASAKCAQNGNTCEWQDVCQESSLTQSNQCFLQLSDTLGWCCGANPVPVSCADGSRFVPNYCYSTSTGDCMPQGFCDRTSIVNINLGIIGSYANTTNTTTIGTNNGTVIQNSTSATQASTTGACNGMPQPTCPIGTQVQPPQCLCQTDMNGNRMCSWSAIVCVIQNGCSSCGIPCPGTQQLTGGFCCNTGSNNNNNTNGTCSYQNLTCSPIPTTACTCENIPATECPCGYKRDLQTAPTCTRAGGQCVLQSKCIPDSCGGFGTSMCNCDYTQCLYVEMIANSTAQALSQNQTQPIYGGCWHPTSDTFRTLTTFPITIFRSRPNSTCGAVVTSTPIQPPTQPTFTPNIIIQPGNTPLGFPISAFSPSASHTPILYPAPQATPTTMQPQAAESQQNAIADKCRQTMSTNLQQSQTNYNTYQTQSANLIDTQTGSTLQGHFRLTLTCLALPHVRTDNSMDMSMVVKFTPLDNYPYPTQEHQRACCPNIKLFLTQCAGFNGTDLSGDCNWQPTYSSQNQKRGLQADTSSPLNFNSFTVTVTAPSSAVNRVFGGNGTATNNTISGITVTNATLIPATTPTTHTNTPVVSTTTSETVPMAPEGAVGPAEPIASSAYGTRGWALMGLTTLLVLFFGL